MRLEDLALQIDRGSSEWALLEHYLMLCTRTSRCTLSCAVRVESVPTLEDTFSKWRRTIHKAFVWVNMEDLDESNDLSRVIKRGFFISNKKGMKFVHGNLVIPGFPTADFSHNETPSNIFMGVASSMRLLLCEIVLGNCLHVDHETDAITENLASEYDSFYIRYPKDDCRTRLKSSLFLGSEACEADDALTISPLTYAILHQESSEATSPQLVVLPPFAFRSHYILFNASQVAVRYIVEVRIDPRAPEYFGLPLCENCNNQKASIWCKVDSASLCISCDEELHMSSKLASRHVRAPLFERPRPHGYCECHPTQIYSYYCMECEESLCHLCVSRCHHLLTYMEYKKIPHQRKHHPMDEQCEHDPELHETPLLPIQEASLLIHVNHSQYPKSTCDPPLRKALLNIDRVRKLRANVESNMASLRDELHASLENAFQQLENIAQNRTQSLLGKKNTLNLMFQLFYLNKHFARYLKSVLPPSDFLISWLKHQRYVTRLFQSVSRVDEDILQDSIVWENLHLDGTLEFHAKKSLKKNHSGTPL